MESKLNKIKDILFHEFKVYNNIYILNGIISKPNVGHFTPYLIDLEADLYALKKGLNYIYDDNLNNNQIIRLENNYKNLNNIPHILIYVKT